MQTYPYYFRIKNKAYRDLNIHIKRKKSMQRLIMAK